MVWVVSEAWVEVHHVSDEAVAVAAPGVRN